MFVAGGVALALAPGAAQAAPTTGTLHGTVGYGGHAAAGTSVFAFNAGLDNVLPIGQGTVSPGGSYTIPGLTPGGGYVICFEATLATPPARGALSECTSNRLWLAGYRFPSTAKPIRITAGATTVLRTNLAAAGAISGRITGSGKPAPRAQVAAFDTAGRPVAGATSDSAGRYTIKSLPPSTTGFAVCAIGAATGLKACAPHTQFTGDSIPKTGLTRYRVVAGRTTAANVDIDVTNREAPTTGVDRAGAPSGTGSHDVRSQHVADGTVTGTVTSAENGGAVAGVTVTVDGSDATTRTQPDGTYSLALPAGSYQLCFRPAVSMEQDDPVPQQPFRNLCPTSPVVVTGQGTTGAVDAALPTR